LFASSQPRAPPVHWKGSASFFSICRLLVTVRKLQGSKSWTLDFDPLYNVTCSLAVATNVLVHKKIYFVVLAFLFGLTSGRNLFPLGHASAVESMFRASVFVLGLTKADRHILVFVHVHNLSLHGEKEEDKEVD
jgi:hypothetical protein